MCRPPATGAVSDDRTPSTLARFTTASILVSILSIWGYYAYPPRDATPGLTTEMHSYKVPLALTAFYLVSLPTLKWITENYLAPKYDMKLLLTESMIIYNVAQVFLNGWMVYAIIDALVYRGHPFIGSRSLTGVAISSGSSYAVWCPWKRFLTQAQLLQFTSVVVYTGFTGYKHYTELPHEAIAGEQPSIQEYFMCCGVQVFEMSYSKKNKEAKAKEDDQCQKAMGEISIAAKEAAGHAAKDAGKLVASASKVVRTGARAIISVLMQKGEEEMKTQAPSGGRTA
eukprot:scaffold213_cov150-Skeletonema_menzelii.AAC.14